MTPQANDIALRVSRLTKVYRKGQSNDALTALDDVSFEVREGEILGIIGANGAGKSTLLKILSEITTPTTGEVTYHGRLTSILDVGTGFHPDLSGRENIFLNGSILGYSKNEITQALPEILEFSGLEDFIEMPVKQYSSGMYLRLAFSVAFHFDMDILVLDEILAVGDSEFRNKCLNVMRKLMDKGKTIILVSHDMQLISEYCGRCLLLAQGKIQFDGNPTEALDHYLGRPEKAAVAAKEEMSCPELTLKSVAINGITNTSAVMDFLEDIQIVSTVELKVKATLESIMYLLDLTGNRVLMSGGAFTENPPEEVLEPGLYELQCTIPPRLLNHGVFTVGLMFSTWKEERLEVPYATKFQVVIPKNIPNRKFYEPITFPIMPHLEWKTNGLKPEKP